MADVAAQGAFECEVAPVQYVHSTTAKLDAPVLIANLGCIRGWELVLEGAARSWSIDVPASRVCSTCATRR